MEDDRGAVLGEDLPHALLFLAVGEHRREHRGRARGARPRAPAGSRRGCPRRGRASTILCGSTRAIWRHSSEPIEPPAPVTSTICAGQVGADPLQLHVHRLAAEHVLDADLAHLAGERAARLQQLEDGRQRAHGDARAAALAHDPRARGAGRGGDGDDHFVGLGLVEDARQVAFGVAPHAHAVDAQPPLARVVVEEADRHEPQLAVAQDLAHDHPPALARARDQDGALALAPRAEGRQRAALVEASARARARRPGRPGRAARRGRSRRWAARRQPSLLVLVAGGHSSIGSGAWAGRPRSPTTRQQHDHEHGRARPPRSRAGPA